MSLPKLTTKSMTILTSILLIAGQILNAIYPHHLFHVNQIMLLTMLLLEYMVIKQMATNTKKLKESITESQVLHAFSTKVEKHSHHRIISFVLVAFFISTMFAVGCLEPTLSGVYGGILGAVVFYIGIQAYIHYLSLLYFSSDLKNIKINDYSFYYPALTKWMREFSKEFQFIEKWFVALGFLYITIYAINIPQGTLATTGLTQNLFLTSWAGIFVLFILAVPFLFNIRKNSLKTVVCGCKANSIHQLEKKLTAAPDDRYAFLIKSVSATENYPL